MPEQLDPLLQRMDNTIASLRSEITQTTHVKSVYDKPFDSKALERASLLKGMVESILCVDAESNLASVREMHCDMFNRLTKQEFNALLQLVHAFVFQDAPDADQSPQSS